MGWHEPGLLIKGQKRFINSMYGIGFESLQKVGVWLRFELLLLVNLILFTDKLGSGLLGPG